MNNLKKLPTKQLEKFSTIFTQLGLVLVLFVVYIILEHKTEQKQLTIIDYEISQKPFLEIDQAIIFKKEVKKKPKIKTPPKTIFLENESIKKGDNTKEESVIIYKTEDEPQIFDLNALDEEPEIEDNIEDVTYDFVQNTPVFKGCEALTEEENKKCFDKKMKKYIQQNFNSEILNDLGLNSGKYKILTQFLIDKNGEVVDVKIRAPHKKLKIQTDKLIKKLPKFTPGMQGDKPVKVRFTLPIIFKID